MDTVGLGASSFTSMFGGDTSQTVNSNSAASEFLVQYVRLNKKQMSLIELHYMSETLITKANDIKSHHNNGKGAYEIRFAKTKLIDDDQYHHHEEIDTLLLTARKCKDMFGFCAVQDASSNMEQRTKEIVGEPDIDEDDPDGYKYARTHIPSTNVANTALPIVNLEARLTEMASLYIHRAADALGLEDVRETLLRNVNKFNDLQVNLDSGIAASTQPNNGPAIPPNMIIGESYEDRGFVPPDTIEKADRAEKFSDVRKEAKLSVSKSLDKLFTRLRYLKPVNFRDGELFLRINKFANQRDIVFCRRLKRKEGDTDDSVALEEASAIREKRLPNNVVIDNTVFVYVWQLPTDEGQLTTPMIQSMMLKAKFNDADNRLIAADFTNVKPIVPFVYKDETPATNVGELSEHDFLNLSSKPTQKEQAVDNREAIGQFLAKGMVRAINRQRDAEYIESLKDFQGVLPSGENSKLQPIAVGTSANTGITALPVTRHYTPAAAISGQTIDDPQQREQRYREHISEFVGISLLQLQGGVGNSKTGSASSSSASASTSAVTGGSQNLSDGASIVTITKDRNDLAAFFEKAVDVFFRDASNEELAKILAVTGREGAIIAAKEEHLLETLREQYEMASESAQKLIDEKRAKTTDLKSSLIAQFQLISNAAKQVASLNHRFSIVFLRQTHLDSSTIAQLRSDGAITSLEAANMLRAKCGFPAMTEEQYKKNRKRQLDEAKEDVDATQPTPEPTDTQKKRKT